MYKFVNEYLEDHYMDLGLSTEEAIMIDSLYSLVCDKTKNLTRTQISILLDLLWEI